MMTESSTIRSANDPTIAGASLAAPSPALQQLIETEWRETGRADLVRSLHRHPDLLRDRSLLMNLAVEEFRVRRNIDEISDLQQYCVRFREFGGSVEQSILRQLEAQRYIDDNFTKLFAQPLWPAPGETFGSFDVLEELGCGSMARVYLCQERDLGQRTVVVKAALHSHVEASILGRLNHPHITPVYSTGFVEPFGLHYICMPYFGRSTLADVIDIAFAAGLPRRDDAIHLAATRWSSDQDSLAERRIGRVLSRVSRRTYVGRVLHLAVQIADALDHGHRQGILHGDLKPSNVLLTLGRRALLLDYNLSQDFASSLRRCGGTLPYMPPEHLRLIVEPGNDRSDSGFDPAPDIYSFGALLYELLAGTPPVTVPDSEIDLTGAAQLFLDQLRHGVPPLRPTNPLVSRRLETFVLRCLSFDGPHRPASMSAIRRSLLTELWLPSAVIRGIRVHPVAFSAVASVPVGLTLAAACYLALRQPVHLAAYEQGLAFASAGRPAQAVQMFNDAIAAEPTFAEARLQRARMNLHLSELDLAMMDFVALAREGDARSMAHLGYCFNLKGADVAAIPWYERAIERGAASTPVFNNLGASYLAAKTHVSRAEQIHRAELYLRKALASDAKSVTVQLNVVRLATFKYSVDRSYDPFGAWRNAAYLLQRRPDDAGIRNYIDEWYRNVRQREAGLAHAALSPAERDARHAFDQMPHAANSATHVSQPDADRVSLPSSRVRFFLEPL